MKRYGENYTVDDSMMATLAEFMIDSERERLHDMFAPCSNDDFIITYACIHNEFEKMLKDEFSITLETEIDELDVF